MLEGRKLSIFVEGTVGAGGHAEAILTHHPEIEKYIAFDRDVDALEIARKRLEPWKEKVVLIHENFDQLPQVLDRLNVDGADGFFLTLASLRCS